MFKRNKATHDSEPERRVGLKYSISRTGVISVRSDALSENTDVRRQVQAAKDVKLRRAAGSK